MGQELTVGAGMLDRQTARSAIRIGTILEAKAEVDVSTGGLLAITALVSGVLLSTSLLVLAARRGKSSPR